MKIILSLAIATAMLASCTQIARNSAQEPVQTNTENPLVLSSEGTHGQYPYLAQNHLGQPVLMWAETDTATGTKSLYYAVSENAGRSFGKPVQVPITHDIKLHGEGMPKIAFQKNGTAIVAYETSRPTENNKYAGAILFVKSADQGKTWSQPRHLHQDTTSGTSHAFFDLATLPDGEVGAVWLCQKADFRDKGRPVKFARTDGSQGFGQEITIEKTACECCRTDLQVDRQGRLHVAFRDLFDDGTRDMAHAQSTDNGRSYSPAKRISNDQWKIEGCPHTGPSLAATASGISCAWFTGREKEQGIYTTHSSGNGFLLRQPVRAQPLASHPQAASPDGKSLVVVWDESARNGEHLYKRVCLQLRQPDGNIITSIISPENSEAFYPVLLPVSNTDVLVAYMQTKGKLQQVRYHVVPLNKLQPEPASVGVFVAQAGSLDNSHCRK